MRFKNQKIKTLFMLAAVLIIGSTLPAFGQTVTFTGVGQLSGGNSSKCYDVSPDGSMVVGDAKNSTGETVAVIYDLYAGSPALISLGFLDSGVAGKYSNGRGIGIDSTENVHVSGTSLNLLSENQAYRWSGDRTGTGAFQAIPFLSSSDHNASGQRLLVTFGDDVLVAGSDRIGGDYRAFRWKASANSTLSLGTLKAGGRSSAYDVGYTGDTKVVGWADGGWWDTAHGAPNSFKWDSTWGMLPQTGLDRVCGGEPWQISAGPDQVANTTKNADNVQVVTVSTTGLVEPDAIDISCGPDNRLKDQLNPAGDDIEWPNGVSYDTNTQSFHRAISSNARYQVGASTYPDDDCATQYCPGGWPRQAHMRDVHNRDHYSPDNCGGVGFLWPLGFLDEDNCSEALGVSNGAGPSKTSKRTGLTVVGWSQDLGRGIKAGSDCDVDTLAAGDDEQVYPVGTTGLDPKTVVVKEGANGVLDSTPATGDENTTYWVNEKRAFACFIKDQTDPQWAGTNDLWFLRHQDAVAGEPGASAASQFKDMKDLKQFCIDNGIDMSGWELREARGVSDDGTVIVGWGVHNGVDEGFVVKVNPPPPTGACCTQTFWGEGTCFPDTLESECTGDSYWLGAGTVCGTNNANCNFTCNDPYADWDDDGDVDQDDFAQFQQCFTGTGGGVPAGGCVCFDRPDILGNPPDGDIDQDDFIAFQNCASGPDVVASTACDD